MYWLVCISYKCFGISEWSARLVPALCVHLTILAVYLLGRRSLGERSALFAAMLLSICPGYLCVARLLLLDGLLTLCITLSLLCGYEAIRQGQFRLGWWLLAALASGLGLSHEGANLGDITVSATRCNCLAQPEPCASEATSRPALRGHRRRV